MYITFQVEPYLAALRDFTGTPGDDETINSVAELLCLLSLAAVQFRSWDGRVVLYVKDNDNMSESGWMLATLGTVWPGTSCLSSVIWRRGAISWWLVPT